MIAEKEQIQTSIETSGVETSVSPVLQESPIESRDTSPQDILQPETFQGELSQNIPDESIDNTNRASRKVPTSDPKRASTWSSLLKKVPGVPPSSL